MASMESYETAYREINKLKRSLPSSTTITIDFSKLDGASENELRLALSNTLAKRSSALSSLIMNSSAAN